MLTDEEIKERQDELKEMEKQIEQKAEEESDQAESSPDPDVTDSPASEAKPSDETAIKQNGEPGEASQSLPPKKGDDDPMDWAQRKGFKTPEDMARALLQKEREFHESRQTKRPQVPEWQPRPEVPVGGYQPSYEPPPPAYVPRGAYRGNAFDELAAMYPQIDPEDLKRFMPVVVDISQSVANRVRDELTGQFRQVQRSTERNNELMTLMQDPAFRDNRVQKEIHAILDADPTIFQRERAPLVRAYEQAMVNLARKQLQQGVNSSDIQNGSQPPVTAGGGTGSSVTGPRRITQKEFERWDIKDQEAFLLSNGTKLPKGYPK